MVDARSLLALVLVPLQAMSPAAPDQHTAGSCLASSDSDKCQPKTVLKSSSALPGDDPDAWAQLLASPAPLLFPASSRSSSDGGGRTDGQQAELLSVVRGWSWERIGEGLGPHARGFVGQPGAYAFPYYEGNMPLEGVPASRGLSRTADPVVITGEELVARVRGTHRSAGTQPSLVYGSQSLLHLKDGEVDERAAAKGPMPPLGSELVGALRQIGAGATTTLASAALWLGSGGSVTPLHYDTSHNVYVQLHGAKRFQLLPPSAAAKAHLYPSLHPGYRQSLLDISAPGLAGFNGSSSQSRGGAVTVPTAKAARASLELAASAVTVTLRPGDALILPPYWLHSVEALTEPGHGVASVACWFSAKDFLRTEAIYAVRLPFQSNWDAVQRATAVFSFLRAVGRGYDRQQHKQQQLDDRGGGHGLALLPALRSRYTQLYTAAFRASVIAQNRAEQLCGSYPPAAAAAELVGKSGAEGRIFAQSGKLEQMMQKANEVAELLLQQNPPAVAALNFANFGKTSSSVLLAFLAFQLVHLLSLIWFCLLPAPTGLSGAPSDVESAASARRAASATCWAQ